MADLPDHPAFEPDQIRILALALDEACEALEISTDAKGKRAAIAARLVDLARTGVIEVEALRDRVVLEARVRKPEPMRTK
jgi:hypothetical protein